jgi:hypothetical protein
MHNQAVSAATAAAKDRRPVMIFLRKIMTTHFFGSWSNIMGIEI